MSSSSGRRPPRPKMNTATATTTIASVVSMNGAPRIAPTPMSSPASRPDTMAMIGSKVSGSAVPTAAGPEPTAPSDRPNPSPIHSIPLVNSSAPAKITNKETTSRTQSIWLGMLPGLLGSPHAMTAPPAASRSDPSVRIRLAFVAALAIALPALWVRWTDPHLSHGIEALLFGLAIVGAAFVLSWAAEVAQLDIAAGLALALLALIAVLPEYAVDFVFAWKGGQAVATYGVACPSGEPGLASPCSLALANMTGANRLLIGIGSSPVVFIAWYRSRRGTAGRPPPPLSEIKLARTHAVEIAFLGVATLYSLTLPLKYSITLFDAGVLIGLFGLYMVRLPPRPAAD